MRSQLIFCSFLMSLFVTAAQAQATLFDENFDACILSPDWQVNVSGNPDPTWYVANTCSNDDATGQSMNGSCFLIIDDDAEGDGTPAYVLDFVSPPFDCSQFSTVELSLDVHYRDWPQGNETLSFWITDGTNTFPIRSFSQTQSTGEAFDEYLSLKFDLSFFTQSPAARLIIRYDDGGGFNWWAGIDNIKVIGSGQGTNVVAESFNACQKPAGWETQILSGQDDWQFGTATNGGQTMNGSCFAFFDDDILGDTAPYSTVRLATPWFDGSDFGQFALTFDLIHRYYSEIFTVLVQHGNGDEFILQEWNDDLGGPNFSDYESQTLDLSAYRNQQMRVVFQYADGNDWGWWSGIDNVKITGSGAANDLCINALDLTTNTPCTPANNLTAIFDGPLPDCGAKPSGGLWYKWQADFSGTAGLVTFAQFNDVVSVFTGTCAAPTLVKCDDYDEHGFIGERTRFAAQNGTTYLIRVSGQEAPFGASRGWFCPILVNAGPAPAPPNNDQCANATTLPINPTGAGTAFSNVAATTSTIVPSHNELARADVWFQFTAPALSASQYLEIASNANFSDIITLYSGGCNALTEVATNHEGGILKVNSLTAGQVYRVQVAGTFATIEGGLTPQIRTKTANAPTNDDCVVATNVPIGGQCTTGTNLDATASGLTPPCVPFVASDVWFKFTAPASGAVRINTGAEFEHVAAIWQGGCNGLNIQQCLPNPLRCNGFFVVGDLAPGQVYFLQICSLVGAAGSATGEVCVKILDINTTPDFEALTLSANAICTGIDQAQLQATALGGTAPFTFSGTHQPGTTLAGGTVFLSIVTDANGCETSVIGVTPECTSGCFVNASLTTTNICGNTPGALTANVSSGNGPFTYAWSTGGNAQTINNLSAGTYTVTITDAGGCTTTSTATLVAGPAIEIILIDSYEPTDVNDGFIIVSANGGSGSYTYAWEQLGDPIIFLDNNPSINNLYPGEYRVTVTDANGCTATRTYVLIGVNTDNLPGMVSSSLTPNPASDLATFRLQLEAATELSLSLTDANGRILRQWQSGKTTQHETHIDVARLPVGVYQLHVIAEHGTLTRRLVVVR
jgi:hypothetical protein